MRAIFLTETILVISSSSLLPASTAGMGCGDHTHTHTHSLRVRFPGRSKTHWSSLYNSSLPSWVNSSVPDTCITGFQFISFQQPLANISSPFLFLLLAFTLSAKSLLVGLQLALWHLPLLISLCCCSCYPWGLNEEQVDVIRSLSGKRMGREPITNQGII